MERFLKAGVKDPVVQRKMTVLLPNVLFGANWGLLEKDQDFLPESSLVWLKDGFLVEEPRPLVLGVLSAFGESLPKRSAYFFEKAFEDEVIRLLNDLQTFYGGFIAIYGTSDSGVAFHDGKSIPCYCVDIGTLVKVCAKVGFGFKVGGIGIGCDVLSSNERQKVFLRSCTLSGGGDSVVVEIYRL